MYQKRIYKTRDLARADVFDYIEMFFTIGPVVIAILVGSAQRHLNVPHFEALECHEYWGKSIVR